MLRGKQGHIFPWTIAISGTLLLIAIFSSRSGLAQDEVRNFKQPILMVETGGSHAQVRSLIWEDPTTLLSGGLDKVVRAWDLRDEPRLSRTFRPMTWRGPAGIIYAMAMSPGPTWRASGCWPWPALAWKPAAAISRSSGFPE